MMKINIHSESIGMARSKVKQLRNVFKKGESEVQKFLEFYDIDVRSVLPHLQDTNGDFGFYKNNNKDWCMYLDAIECMDLFVKLNDDRK